MTGKPTLDKFLSSPDYTGKRGRETFNEHFDAERFKRMLALLKKAQIEAEARR